MRKIKTVSTVLALFAVMSVFANKGKKKVANENNNLSGQIYEMLKDNQFNLEESGDLTAEVSFIINEKGEVVVLSVETKDEILEGFVKSRLNYKKVASSAVVPGRVYEVPVRITA
ncbi:hypothetical protein [Allomuricauda sp. NBRC 101325]|uniref:hypothetical protein n=1 Tax=Allomuricauda sp. NBRC 101325 TaxID=1113758 RepID=UPI00249FF935|nr:hypothetical protein [Muricauda sp. NBRC 101325]GLU44136.1 hypothetical protein Musp01_17600 [Muricauda sp. NBRC 101325]